MIYTSYFGNIKKVKADIPDAAFISIAGRTPDWFIGVKFPRLMPKYVWWKEWHDTFWADLNSQESRDWYIKKYRETVLASLDILQTARDIKDAVGWHIPVLLCYETPEKFCHRHIVADWLNSGRVEAKEWKAALVPAVSTTPVEAAG